MRIIKEDKKDENAGFKVGDRVQPKAGKSNEGKKGTIIGFFDGFGVRCATIEFDEKIPMGHGANCDTKGKDGHCWDYCLTSIKKIDEKCQTNESKQEPKFKVGDRVRFKSWEQMEKEFGLDKDGDIKPPDGTYFTKGMRYLCGRYATIESIDGLDIGLKEFSPNNYLGWNYTTYMIEPVSQKGGIIFDGKKTTFVKDDTKYMVELADGDTYDKEKGVLLAIAKAHGFEYHDICRFIKEAQTTYYCCFCGKELSKVEQNDRRPIVSERGEFCCDKCNAEIVVPTRRKVW